MFKPHLSSANLLTAITLCFTAAWPVNAALPAAFTAEYRGSYKGLPLTAKGLRKLEEITPGNYRFISSAKSIIASVSETAMIEVLESDFRPVSYDYKRGGKTEFARFDWQNMQLTHHEGVSPLETGTWDKLSYQLRLQLDVARLVDSGNEDEIITYRIADEEKLKEYQFQITGRETLETSLGLVETVRVERLHSRAERSTMFWLAPAHDYLLIKLRQLKSGREFELNIQSVQTPQSVQLP